MGCQSRGAREHEPEYFPPGPEVADKERFKHHVCGGGGGRRRGSVEAGYYTRGAGATAVDAIAGSEEAARGAAERGHDCVEGVVLYEESYYWPAVWAGYLVCEQREKETCQPA